jgi:hypothetical protein
MHISPTPELEQLVDNKVKTGMCQRVVRSVSALTKPKGEPPSQAKLGYTR